MDNASENKALNLLDYFLDLSRLRQKSIKDIGSYKNIFWLSEIPKNEKSYCFTQAWGTLEEDDEKDSDWIRLKKCKEPLLPAIPKDCIPWVDQDALLNKKDIPSLNSSATIEQQIPNPDWDPEDPENSEEEEFIITTKDINLENYPEVSRQWDSYVENKWMPWQEQHERWEPIHKPYSSVFTIYQEEKKLGEEYELLLGVGLLSWNNIKRHLITANAEIIFDPKGGQFTVNIPHHGPQLSVELDMLEESEQIPRETIDEYNQMLESSQDPWDRATIDTILTALANQLSNTGNGEYFKNNLAPSQKSIPNKPVIEFAPAIILRKRSIRGFSKVINKIRTQIEGGGKIPSHFLDISESNNLEHSSRDNENNRNINNPSTTPHQEIYFPKLYNEEQKRIIDSLNNNSGVLVQGPPGTGKSHTIANLICHLLATGQRVLVTAQTPRALKVLENQLPKEMKPLCVNFLGTGIAEQESLSSSVNGILIKKQSFSPDIEKERIKKLEFSLKELRSNREKTKHKLKAFREKETFIHHIASGTYSGTASKIVLEVKENETKFNWFKDQIDPELEIPVAPEDLLNIQTKMEIVPKEIINQPDILIPKTGEHIPTAEEFSELVSKYKTLELKASKWEQTVSTIPGNQLNKIDSKILTSIFDALSNLNAEIKTVLKRPMKWIPNAVSEMLADNDTPWKTRLASCQKFNLSTLKTRAEKTQNHEITKPADCSIKKFLKDAKEINKHFAQGGGLGFGIFRSSVFKGRDYILKEIKVDGFPPNNLENSNILIEHLEILDQVEDLWKTWQGLTEKKDLALLFQIAELEELEEALIRVVGIYELHQKAKAEINKAVGTTEPAWHISTEFNEFLEACETILAKEKLNLTIIEFLKHKESAELFCAKTNSHEITKKIPSVIQSKNPDEYKNLILEINLLKDHQETIRLSNTSLEKLKSAAPLFTNEFYQSSQDSHWEDKIYNLKNVWNWARAKSWAAKFLSEDDSLSHQIFIKQLDQDINKALEELSARKAWVFCVERMAEEHKRNLIAWRDNVKKVGKGTGKHAPEYRRRAQNHLNQCKEAIPAWIMPIHRVWDTVDPAPGIFDVIIVDEASQCDFQSIPLFYLGKELIIVGDDQQISPQSPGINKTTVKNYMENHLSDFKHSSSFDAENSLFAHAQLRFPTPIVLREHFRSMPEIIRFSNDLCYQDTPLIPLRQYPPERLEPLKYVHVEGGVKKGSGYKAINEPEADEIVKTITKCCNDEKYDGKTMGVIALQGNSQASLIEGLLLKAIGAEEMEKRKLLCGDPYNFQGDERDIIFLSMVVAENESFAASTTQNHQKRYNVAASRARDQMWLFHSPTINYLSANCLRRRLLDHFIDPKSHITMALGDQAETLREKARSANRQIEKPPDPFESWFELDVALRIASRGYRVIPQYPAIENKRIDLVVEGEISKLAVECDGDHWHGPDDYEKDMHRQMRLERAGWEFFRIRQSTFSADPEAALKPLWSMLREHRIYPVGEQSSNYSSDRTEKPDNNKGADNTSNFTDSSKAEAPLEARRTITKDSTKINQSTDRDAVSSDDNYFSNENSNVLIAKDPYIEFKGGDLKDPVKASKSEIAEGLCLIVEAEGPMLAKKAYDIYLRSLGIKKLGSQLKSTMNKAMQYAINRNKITTEDEWNKGGVIYSIVRIKNSKPIKVREQGSRLLNEIPPSELQAVSVILRNEIVGLDNEEKLIRNVLNFFGFKRITPAVKKTYKDANKIRFTYVDQYVKENKNPDKPPSEPNIKAK